MGFHYSDFWADPAVQLLPKAWEKDRNNQEKMCSNVYEFTKETLEQFKDAGADIGIELKPMSGRKKKSLCLLTVI